MWGTRGGISWLACPTGAEETARSALAAEARWNFSLRPGGRLDSAGSCGGACLCSDVCAGGCMSPAAQRWLLLDDRKSLFASIDEVKATLALPWATPAAPNPRPPFPIPAPAPAPPLNPPPPPPPPLPPLWPWRIRCHLGSPCASCSRPAGTACRDNSRLTTRSQAKEESLGVSSVYAVPEGSECADEGR